MPNRRRLLSVLLIVLAALATMGQDGCDTSTDEPTIKEGDGGGDEGGATPEVANVGDKLTLKGTTYQVTDVSTAESLGSSFTKTEANGVFVVVDLTLQNEENEPATVLEENLKLIGGNDSEYSTSTDAALAIDDAFVILEEIQPGVKQSGKLVYDVPPKAVSGSRLQVEDLFSDSTGQIDLDL
jgi:hypothetical protein